MGLQSVETEFFEGSERDVLPLIFNAVEQRIGNAQLPGKPILRFITSEVHQPFCQPSVERACASLHALIIVGLVLHMCIDLHMRRTQENQYAVIEENADGKE